MAKAENVVNPPQNPVASSNRMECALSGFRDAKANTKPMMKHPNKFTKKVPHGHLPGKAFIANKEKMYLAVPPMALPDNTNTRSRMGIIGYLGFLKRCS